MGKEKVASVEVHFAQRLAANEKKIRDRAMKKLRKWFEVKSLTKKDKAFSEEDFLKIWKGLHYCLWMQDKPLLQEEMSAFISRLVHVFTHTDTALLFIQVYLQTEAREWNGIDRWRMDKFMMLFRNMLTQSLEFLKKHKWKKGLITKFTEILSGKVMTVKEDRVPDGLKIHLADIYLDELEKVGSTELPPEKVLQLLEPFTKYIQNSRNLVIVERVVSRVFDAIIKQTIDDAMIAAEKQIENEDSDDEEKEDIDEDVDLPPRLQFDFKALADTLFEMGSSKDCVSKNRNMIYMLVKKFKDLEEGVLPVEPEEEEEGDVLTKKDIALAVQQLGNLDKPKKKKKRKKKKKKNSQEESDDNMENAVDSDTSNRNTEAKIGKRKMENKTETKDVSPPKKKKGMNERKKNQDSIVGNEKINSDSHSVKTNSQDKNKINGSKEKHKSVGFDTLELKHLKDKEGSMSPDNKNVETPLSEIYHLKNKKGSKKLKGSASLDSSELMGGNPVIPSKGDNSVQTPSKSSKQKRKSLNTTSVETVDNALDLSQKEKVVLKDKKGKKSSQNLPEEQSIATPSNKKTPKTKKTNSNKLEDSVGLDLQKSEGSGFAKFDKVMKTPPAFVRKSVAKLKTPKAAAKFKSLEPPASCPPDTKKKVIFNMKKNESLSFKESIQFSPEAFNPSSLPDHGILKTPSPAVTRSKSAAKQKGKRRASTGVIRATAADFF